MTSENMAILFEVLQYMKEFREKTFVVKVGGAALEKEEAKTSFAKSIVFLRHVQVNPIIVHGGGVEITRLMNQLGIKPLFKNGYRVTDEKTLQIAEMVLEKINKDIVLKINLHGGRAIGVSGKDDNLLLCEKDIANGDIGYVGKIRKVNSGFIEKLIAQNYIPVICPVGFGEDGTTYNINADVAAAEIAISLKAEKLIFVSDVPGVMKDGELIPYLDVRNARKLIEEGVVKGGMIPKIQCAVNALKVGIKSVHVVNGEIPHALLTEIFTLHGIGTMLREI